MITAIVVLSLIVLALSAILYMRMVADQEVSRLLIEYKRSFPNACPVCGFFRYAHREFGKPFDPPPHDCAEAHRPLEERMINAPLMKSSALTIEEAQERRVCRFCELGDTEGPGLPFSFNFGNEYAHKKCVQENMF